MVSRRRRVIRRRTRYCCGSGKTRGHRRNRHGRVRPIRPAPAAGPTTRSVVRTRRDSREQSNSIAPRPAARKFLQSRKKPFDKNKNHIAAASVRSPRKREVACPRPSRTGKKADGEKMSSPPDGASVTRDRGAPKPHKISLPRQFTVSAVHCLGSSLSRQFIASRAAIGPKTGSGGAFPQRFDAVGFRESAKRAQAAVDLQVRPGDK